MTCTVINFLKSQIRIFNLSSNDKTYGNDDVFMYPAQYSADVIKNKNINDG